MVIDMSENNLPITFKVGDGGTIVNFTFKEGIFYIRVTRNSTDMEFINGHSLSVEENTRYEKQVKQIPDAVFEFTDLELGIKFYSGFFREPCKTSIERIRSLHSMWHLTICA